MPRLFSYAALVSLFFVNGTFAGLPEMHPVNGGITIIPVESRQKPLAYFNNSPVVSIESSKRNLWLLVIGIPLDIKESIQQSELKKPYRGSIPFYVSEKPYTTQYLTIKDPRKVNPFDEDIARITEEEQKLKTIYSNFTSQNPFANTYQAPLKGPVSSLFGLNRVYNQVSRPPHSGLDIAAGSGTPVAAISQGVVAATGDYFYTGNTVIIDHGMGVFSLYGHLSSIAAKPGQNIARGEIIGKVGQTGRATGPHLHWSMIMNRTLVDPLLFVSYKTITTMPPKEKEKTKG